MGKHNGKARTSGQKVGSVLVNKARKEGKGTKAASVLLGRHTTDTSKYGMQSVLETNDLNEIMNMADLAGRDFSAERGQSVVVSTGGAAIGDLDREMGSEARAVAEERNRHRLCIPRRPAWSRDMTAEQVNAQEKEAFLAWRRDLARLEEDERLVLTPFEKNLEVWRQLWRVLERSDIVVQVIDARDPLTYRSSDLEDYARDISRHKRSMLLLNKSDLLPEAARIAWADYFDSQGVSYIFWSAKLAAAADDDSGESPLQHQTCRDERVRLLTCDQLVAAFQAKAAAAAAAAGTAAGSDADQASSSSQEQQRRLVVGLTGYPNVGKSSTINALFGSKKTAVAATPGKTKHFQTLIISDALLLCDCPGLVLPRYAQSKAEMVAAGVIPIDRLTDVRAPVEVVLRQAGVRQIERVYNITVPHKAGQSVAAPQMLAALASARGWTTGAGLPDEARAGRQVLRDFCDGKLVSFCLPPTAARAEAVPGVSAPLPGASDRRVAAADAPSEAAQPDSGGPAAAGGAEPGHPDAAVTAGPSLQRSTDAAAMASATGAAKDGTPATSSPAMAQPTDGGSAVAQQPGLTAEEDISEADLALMEELELGGGGGAKPRRASHKFHGKASRRRMAGLVSAH